VKKLNLKDTSHNNYVGKDTSYHKKKSNDGLSSSRLVNKKDLENIEINIELEREEKFRLLRLKKEKEDIRRLKEFKKKQAILQREADDKLSQMKEEQRRKIMYGTEDITRPEYDKKGLQKVSEKNIKSNHVLKKKPFVVKENQYNENSEFFRTYKDMPKKNEHVMYNTVRDASKDKYRKSHDKGRNFKVKDSSSNNLTTSNAFLNNKKTSHPKVKSKQIKLKKKKEDGLQNKKSDRKHQNYTDGFRPYLQEQKREKSREANIKKGMSKTKPHFNKELYGSDIYAEDMRKSKSRKKIIQEMDHSALYSSSDGHDHNYSNQKKSRGRSNNRI